MLGISSLLLFYFCLICFLFLFSPLFGLIVFRFSCRNHAFFAFPFRESSTKVFNSFLKTESSLFFVQISCPHSDKQPTALPTPSTTLYHTASRHTGCLPLLVLLGHAALSMLLEFQLVCFHIKNKNYIAVLTSRTSATHYCSCRIAA